MARDPASPHGGRVGDDELYEEAFGEARDSPLGPHHERVSEAYAEERIGEKLTMMDEKPRAGLENVSRDLKRAGVPAAVRLHYISTVTHLGRLGSESLAERVRHVERK